MLTLYTVILNEVKNLLSDNTPWTSFRGAKRRGNLNQRPRRLKDRETERPSEVAINADSIISLVPLVSGSQGLKVSEPMNVSTTRETLRCALHNIQCEWDCHVGQGPPRNDVHTINVIPRSVATWESPKRQCAINVVYGRLRGDPSLCSGWTSRNSA